MLSSLLTGICISWFRKKADKQVQIDAFRRSCSDVSPSTADEILSLSATELARRIRAGELSAVDAVQTVGAKAIEADAEWNCLTELFLNQAIGKSACT